MRTNSVLSFLFIVLLSLTSCEHKELCLHHIHSVPYRIDIDWDQYIVEQPEGMTVYVYPEQQGKTERLISNNIDFAIFDLYSDTYRFLVHNYSQSELSSLDFLDMDDFENARVMAASTTSRWYTLKSDEEVIAEQPQWFGLDVSEEVVVTQQMVDEHYGRLFARSDTLADVPLLTTLVPENIIWTVKVNVKNIRQFYNLSDIRGSISDMARGYYLTQGRRSSEKATYILEEWSIAREESDPSVGMAEVIFTCFGLPYGHNGDSFENVLLLQILLVDLETIVEIPLEVGDLFRKEHSVGANELYMELTLDLNYILPDVPPAGEGDGGFDATVDDWEEEIEVEIDLNDIQ